MCHMHTEFTVGFRRGLGWGRLGVARKGLEVNMRLPDVRFELHFTLKLITIHIGVLGFLLSLINIAQF